MNLLISQVVRYKITQLFFYKNGLGAASNLEQVLAATPHKTPIVRPSASFHENYPS